MRQTGIDWVTKAVPRRGSPHPCRQNLKGCLGPLSPHLASEGPIPRKVSMERGPTFVGINVAKAQVDVAVRPSGDI